MTDFSPTSKAPSFKDAFYQVAKNMFALTAVQVTFGHPGIMQADDMIAFMDMTSEQHFATMSASRRSREETLTLKVMVSSFRNGNADNDQAPSDAAYGLMSQLEEYVRITDTTLGGAVRECFLTSHTSTGYTDPQSLAQGRTVDIEATFTAKARVTS